MAALCRPKPALDILLLHLLRRSAALLVVSVVGISLIAPLAARSGVDVLEPADDRLLATRPTEATSLAPRGLLVTRVARTAAGATGGVEVIGEPGRTTPRAVAMSATLVPIPTPPPPPAPAPRPAPATQPAQAAPAPSGDGVWDALAQCESGGNWSINTGNGYYGGLQFSYGTWHDYGGGAYAQYPHQATKAQQIAVAEKLRAARGFQPWPACRVKLGLP